MLPDPLSLYFAVLGGLLFGMLSALYHPALSMKAAFLMLTFVFIFFFGLQIIDDVIREGRPFSDTLIRLTTRFYAFIFATMAGVAILRWFTRRWHDRLP